MIELIQRWWDKVTGKAELRWEYIERINDMHDRERGLMRHLMKLYPNQTSFESFYGSFYENHINDIVAGKAKYNPIPQYTEEEIKQYRDAISKQKHDGATLMDWRWPRPHPFDILGNK